MLSAFTCAHGVAWASISPSSVGSGGADRCVGWAMLSLPCAHSSLRSGPAHPGVRQRLASANRLQTVPDDEAQPVLVDQCRTSLSTALHPPPPKRRKDSRVNPACQASELVAWGGVIERCVAPSLVKVLAEAFAQAKCLRQGDATPNPPVPSTLRAVRSLGRLVGFLAHSHRPARGPAAIKGTTASCGTSATTART